MRFLFAMVALAAVGSAQVTLDPARLPSGVTFERTPGESTVNCDVSAMRPYIDFGFHFRAGYVVRIPLNQYEGKGHRWAILTRITPEGGGAPVHLVDVLNLPEVPKTKLSAEVGQGFLLGEGRYQVEVLLLDDHSRRCRGRIRVEAKRGRSEAKLDLRIEPNTVRSVVSRLTTAKPKPGERPYRISVLANVAPMWQRSTRLRPWDREILLGALGPLLDQLPAQSVRLVMFSLDQQKTILARNGFQLEEMNDVAHVLNGLELGTVPYSVLTNKRGHLEQLADLIREELSAAEPPDAIVFLGPQSRHIDRFPQSLIEARGGGDDPKYFYVQYRPPVDRGAFSDVLENAVKTLKGKTFHVHSPGEFASAIRQISRIANGDGRN